MFDFRKKWADLENNLERQKDNLSEETYKAIKSNYKSIYEKLKDISTLFGKTEEEIKQIIPPYSYLLKCKKDELQEKYSYFESIFGDDLLEIINLDHIETPHFYNGIFSYKDKTIIERKIQSLKSIFNISDKKVINLIRYSSKYIFYGEKRIKEYIGFLCQYLDLNYNDVIALYLIYPKIIDISPGLIKSRVERLCAFFNCTEQDIKEMYKKYIPSLCYTPSEINLFLRFNSNRNSNMKKRVKSMPWVVQCGSRCDQKDFCRFGTLEELLRFGEFVEKTFGKVERVFIKNWTEKNKEIRYLLIRTEQNYLCLLCLGVFTREYFLLEKIFGPDPEAIPRLTFQIIGRDYESLNEYFIRSCCSYGSGIRGIYMKNGDCIVEIDIYTLNKFLKEPIFNFKKNKFNDYMSMTLRLDKELSKKHKEFYEKNQRLSNELNDLMFEEDDIDLDKIFETEETVKENYENREEKENFEYITSIFGSSAKFEDYINKLKN